MFLIVASSLLAVAYVWRFVEAAYFREPRQRHRRRRHAFRWSMVLPAGLLVAATVYFGLDTSFTVGSAAQAAAALLGVRADGCARAGHRAGAGWCRQPAPLLIALAAALPNLREADHAAVTAVALFGCVLDAAAGGVRRRTTRH